MTTLQDSRFPASPHVFEQEGSWHWGITVPRVHGSGFKLIAFSKRVFPIEDEARIDGGQTLRCLPDNVACDITR